MLEAIFDNLSQKDLATNTIVSRRFRDIVEPLLYCTLHIKLPALTEPVFSTGWHDGDVFPIIYERFLGLLEKLAQNLKLRSCITLIYFRSKGRTWDKPVTKIDP